MIGRKGRSQTRDPHLLKRTYYHRTFYPINDQCTVQTIQYSMILYQSVQFERGPTFCIRRISLLRKYASAEFRRRRTPDPGAARVVLRAKEPEKKIITNPLSSLPRSGCSAAFVRQPLLNLYNEGRKKLSVLQAREKLSRVFVHDGHDGQTRAVSTLGSFRPSL